MVKTRRALVSLADKRNLDSLVAVLKQFGVETIATGQTAELLKEKGLNVLEVSAITDFPEILGGRVKTLHPFIHGAILARPDHQQDKADLKTHGLTPIDLVVVNLYDFTAGAKKSNAISEAVEYIDIGGSALLRAAAKNYHYVTLISSPDDYQSLARELKQNDGSISQSFRAERAIRAYRLSAAYDSQIGDYLAGEIERPAKGEQGAQQEHDEDARGEEENIVAIRLATLRYGENPHQKASLYATSQPPRGLAAAPLLQGKPLSYNNLIDADMASRIVQQFSKPVCVIVKHTSPCGVAERDRLVDAYLSAFNADRESAFGGVLAFNRELDEETATAIVTNQFAELVIAPQVSSRALQQLAARKNLRVVEFAAQALDDYHIRFVAGGLLKQESDGACLPKLEWVTKKRATKMQEADLLFAWRVVKLCHSNAIVIARKQASCGIGQGQTSRVFSVRCALMRAADNGIDLEGAVLASDAFFPFADSIEFLADTGVSAVIQPGGSKRDEEVIEAADKRDIAMAFTYQRAFFHG